MSTYLFTWSPKSWSWKTLEAESEAVKSGKSDVYGRWSCGNTRKIRVGDRFFLLKQGSKEPTGIFGSGLIRKKPFEAPHWEPDRAKSGDRALYVGVSFDMLLNPTSDEILSRDFLLRDKVFSRVNWNTQRSGIEIDPDVASQLEVIWNNLVLNSSFVLADEVSSEIFEGAKKSITVNAYERNPEARRKCIEYHGSSCSACGIDFDEFYGPEIASSYIHVHHTKPLSEIRKEYLVNPKDDLIPVCPNCHAMLHRRKPAFTVEELRKIIEKHSKSN